MKYDAYHFDIKQFQKIIDITISVIDSLDTLSVYCDFQKDTRVYEVSWCEIVTVHIKDVLLLEL